MLVTCTSRRLDISRSLSWVATVYLELHVGLLSAYALSTGFIFLECVMIVAWKPCFGESNVAFVFLLKHTDLLQ
jgi:hypothetical protein